MKLVMEFVMHYMLVVSKDVAIPPQEFVAKWNADPTCRVVARASIDYSTKSVYEPNAAGSPLPVLETFACDVATAPFYELIKIILCKPRGHKPTEIIQLEKPNGARVLLIKGAEVTL